METRDYQSILASAADGIATLTLNLPERKNPLGPLMVNELLWALDDAKADADVRVVILTGAGKAFCAGGDLKQMSTGDGPALEPKGDYTDLLLRFGALGKPTIARIPGYAMGGGLGLVASCDFAVACESAILGTPEIRRGLFPMMIMAVLQRVVPRRELMRMMLLPRAGGPSSPGGPAPPPEPALRPPRHRGRPGRPARLLRKTRAALDRKVMDRR
jgi:enoyl-CoA hydratase/carnithine racemase